jgi:DnaJ-class molecular chaperone
MKKIKAFKKCHICNGLGEKGFFIFGDFHSTGKCMKCNGTGYLK